MRLIALSLFLVASLTDIADGYFARKYGVITGFGKFMDPLADKILVSSALIAFIALNYVAPLPVLFIIGREFAITGLRLLVAYQGVIIPPSQGAKIKTFLQMTLVGLVLAYITIVNGLFQFGTVPTWLSDFDYRFFLNIFVWVTAVITVWTGIGYVVKYFHLIRSALR